MNNLYGSNIILYKPLKSIHVLKFRIWYILIPQEVTEVKFYIFHIQIYSYHDIQIKMRTFTLIYLPYNPRNIQLFR